MLIKLLMTYWDVLMCFSLNRTSRCLGAFSSTGGKSRCCPELLSLTWLELSWVCKNVPCCIKMHYDALVVHTVSVGKEQLCVKSWVQESARGAMGSFLQPWPGGCVWQKCTQSPTNQHLPHPSTHVPHLPHSLDLYHFHLTFYLWLHLILVPLQISDYSESARLDKDKTLKLWTT